MASKTPSDIARTAAYENALIQERPCDRWTCSGTMRIVVKAKGWKSVWQCKRCQHEATKNKKDWTLAQALKLKECK